MSEFALRCAGLGKSYGATPVLGGVSLDVRRGEWFGLTGANGAGKTTLIKCVLDLSATDAGVIEIFGAGHRLPGARACLAYLPERFTPPFYLSGRDFLRYMLELHRTRYDEAEAAHSLAELDFPVSALGSLARTYSKGMTQKLGLAACLLSRKELLVFDEPTSGLDPRARALFKQALRATRPAGRTVLLTSHALADIEELCDRMAILHQGQIRFVGSPDELRRHYAAPGVEEAFLACIARVPALARTRADGDLAK